jgi:DNA-binding PadR family transcriptional regulator
MMPALHRKYDVTALMQLLEILAKKSRGEDVTVSKLAKYSRQVEGSRTLVSVYRYMTFAHSQGLVRINRAKDPRPFGVAKYYFLSPAGAAFLQAWQESKKEVLKKNGN